MAWFGSRLQGLVMMAAMSVLCMTPAQAQVGEFPSRALRMVIPWPAGGITDVAGRIVAQQLSVELGQPVVVDNRPGASGRIGMQSVSRTAADGYTIFLGNGASMSVLGAVDPTLPYDPVKDFAPISLLSESPVGLLTSASLPPDNLGQFIALAKARPKSLTFASPGAASTFHLLTELFLAQAGIEAVHVPFQGSAPATNAVIAGTVDFQLDSGAKQYVDSKMLKILAVTGSRRWFLFPDVPTFAELGLGGLEKASWLGLFAPPGTPQPVIERLNAATNAALRQTGVINVLTANGYIALGGSIGDLQDYLSTDLARWKKVVAANPSLQKR